MHSKMNAVGTFGGHGMGGGDIAAFLIPNIAFAG